jgi:hypothetical protein
VREIDAHRYPDRLDTALTRECFHERGCDVNPRRQPARQPHERAPSRSALQPVVDIRERRELTAVAGDDARDLQTPSCQGGEDAGGVYPVPVHDLERPLAGERLSQRFPLRPPTVRRPRSCTIAPASG